MKGRLVLVLVVLVLPGTTKTATTSTGMVPRTSNCSKSWMLPFSTYQYLPGTENQQKLERGIKVTKSF